MEVINSIVSIGVIITAVLLTIGLIRPGFVIWWHKANSRKQVFLVWGGLFMFFTICYFFLNWTRHDTLKQDDANNPEMETHQSE